MEINKIYNENCLDTMSKMPDNFIDLTVTSPPYDNLRTYNGYSFDFESIAKELFRVTKQGGVVVWVVKDATVNGNKSLTSFKQCLYFQSVGFNVYDTMIYSKTSGGLPHKGRYRDAVEFMFVLSKGKPKTVNLIKDRKNKYGGTHTFGKTTVRERDGVLGDRKQILVEEVGYRYNIWEYATGRGNTTADTFAFEHPAMFPERLCADHIVSWSNENDLVYDPFMGSGTTAKMSILNKRNWVGSEISDEYCEIAKQRIFGAEQKMLNSVT
jgi:site-specific DNA-methyltransferase (adenine-specific)